MLYCTALYNSQENHQSLISTLLPLLKVLTKIILPYSMTRSILFLFIILANTGLFAQSSKPKKKKDIHFEMTLSAGVAYAQSINDMSYAMEIAGLDDDYHSKYGTYTYPEKEKEFGVLDLSLMYKWNDHSGIVLGGSILERFSLRGRSDVDDGVLINLETNVHHVRCQYQWRTLNSRFLMTVGPSLTFFKIVDTYPALFWQQNYSSSSLSVAGGIQYNVINLDAFFVSLSINGQYVLPTEIGIFRAHRIHVPPNAFSNVVYRPTDIHFGNIGAYLGVGLRL